MLVMNLATSKFVVELILLAPILSPPSVPPVAFTVPSTSKDVPFQDNLALEPVPPKKNVPASKSILEPAC